DDNSKNVACSESCSSSAAHCPPAFLLWRLGPGPILAEPTKAWLLETYGLTLKEGFAATITEYLIYTFVTTAMSIGSLAYLITRFGPPPTTRGSVLGIVCYRVP